MYVGDLGNTSTSRLLDFCFLVILSTTLSLYSLAMLRSCHSSKFQLIHNFHFGCNLTFQLINPISTIPPFEREPHAICLPTSSLSSVVFLDVLSFCDQTLILFIRMNIYFYSIALSLSVKTHWTNYNSSDSNFAGSAPVPMQMNVTISKY